MKLAIFDTAHTFPGISFPGELLPAPWIDLNILSLVDGVHGDGDIDRTSRSRFHDKRLVHTGLLVAKVLV